MSNPLRHYATSFAVLLAWVAAVVWLTWPLAATLGTTLPNTTGPCRFDTLVDGWILAHLTHALVAAPSTLAHGNIYHPEPYALFYGQTAVGALPLFGPVFQATGNPTAALNATLLGGAALTAWSIDLTLRRATGSALAGIVGASTFLTSRWLLWDMGPTAPFYACLELVPPIMLVVARTDRPPWWLFPLLVAQCAIDVVYATAAVLVPLATIALARLVRPASRRAGRRLLAMVALTPLALAPIYAGHLVVAARNPMLAEQTNWLGGGSPLYPWLGQHLTKIPWGFFGDLAPMSVPPIVALLVALGLLCLGWRPSAGAPRTLWMHAAVWITVGMALSLTPAVEWQGRIVHLPQAFFADTTLVRLVREPERIGLAGLMGISILAGLAFAELASRVRLPAGRIALALLVLGLMHAEYARGFASPFVRRPLPARYPTFAPEQPSSLDALVRAGHGPLVEVPLGPGETSAFFHAGPVYRSIRHWRPILNGYDGHYPARFPERMSLAARLPDPTALDALRRDTGLRTVVVHLALEIDAAARTAWSDLADAGGNADLRLVARDGDDLLFDVVER